MDFVVEAKDGQQVVDIAAETNEQRAHLHQMTFDLGAAIDPGRLDYIPFFRSHDGKSHLRVVVI